MKKDLSYAEKKNVIKATGELYQAAKRRIDIIQYANRVEENWNAYMDDRKLIHSVERCLQDCGTDTKLIIQHEYLEAKEYLWYMNYYSRTTYYRLKKIAVEEFYNKMGF